MNREAFPSGKERRSKISEAKNKGIEFFHEIDNLKGMEIEDIDLCSLLANLLDNAIEACEKINDKKSLIVLKIKNRQSIFIIQLTNSVKKEMLEKTEIFKTDKKDIHIHGWGMRSIDQVICKYGGSKEYYLYDSLFTMSLFTSVFK